MGRVDLRCAFFFERARLGLANHTDDFAREVFIAPDREPLSDGRGLGSEVFDCNLPVHDHDFWRAGIVPFVESPASEERNWEGLKIRGGNRGPTRVHRLIRGGWPAFRNERPSNRITACLKRKIYTGAHRLDAGEWFEPLDERAV